MSVEINLKRIAKYIVITQYGFIVSANKVTTQRKRKRAVCIYFVSASKVVEEKKRFIFSTKKKRKIIKIFLFELFI